MYLITFVFVLVNTRRFGECCVLLIQSLHNHSTNHDVIGWIVSIRPLGRKGTRWWHLGWIWRKRSRGRRHVHTFFVNESRSKVCKQTSLVPCRFG